MFELYIFSSSFNTKTQVFEGNFHFLSLLLKALNSPGFLTFNKIWLNLVNNVNKDNSLFASSTLVDNIDNVDIREWFS